MTKNGRIIDTDCVGYGHCLCLNRLGLHGRGVFPRFSTLSNPIESRKPNVSKSSCAFSGPLFRAHSCSFVLKHFISSKSTPRAAFSLSHRRLQIVLLLLHCRAFRQDPLLSLILIFQMHLSQKCLFRSCNFCN